MAEREKEVLLTRDVVPMKFDLTEKGEAKQPENLVRIEVHVYERVGRPPVFVAFERNDSPYPYTEELRKVLLDWALVEYALKPDEILFFEKTRDADQYQRIRCHDLGAEQERTGQWTIETRYGENNLTAKEIDALVGGSAFKEPELGQRIDRPEPLETLKKPPAPVYSIDR